MKWNDVAVFVLVVLTATAVNSFSAESNWAGQYTNKNFLNGEAVFDMSITQSRSVIQVAFDAAYNDAHGAAPDGVGQGRLDGRNTVEFKWKDSFHNSGTGTITRAGNGIVVSMKTRQVGDSRCLAFYGKNIRLKRTK